MIFVDNRGSYENEYPRLSLEEISTRLSKHKLICVDTETTGLDPYHNEVIMLQIGTKEEQYIIDTRVKSKALDKYIKPILEDSTVTKVLVNAKFDLKMLRTSFNIGLVNVVDCMLQEQIIVGAGFTDGRYSYKALAKKYLGYDADKDVGKEFLHVGTKPFSDSQVQYGAADVLVPIFIHEFQQSLLEHNKQTIAAQLENKFVEVLANIELKGMYLDQDKWLKVYEYNKTRLNWYKYLLAEKLLDLGVYTEFKNINWNSSKQVVTLFKQLGIPTRIINQSKSTDDTIVYKDSVAKDHVHQFYRDYPIISLYLMYKQYHKLTTTYGIKFFKHIHTRTSRVHSNYTQMVSTGRLASSKPNLQNISSGSKYRSCFVPKEGKVFVVADYDSQESRVMADLSGDLTLKDFFLNGDGDLHSFTARKMFKIPDTLPVPKDKRKVSKTLNFGIPYGMGASKLAKQFMVTIKEADKFIKQWLSAYPDLKRHFTIRRNLTHLRGYVTVNDVTGFRAYHREHEKYLLCKYALEAGSQSSVVKSTYFRISASLERMSQNYEIQGTAAAITKLACIYIDQEITRNKLDAAIINIVHDEIIVESSIKDANMVYDIMKSCMERAGAVFCSTIPITTTPLITLLLL